MYRLGFAYLIPQHWKRLRLTAEQAEQEIAGHTFLFVGGPHRGGTTILWKCLREHPLISGFGDRVGTDYSEGIFLQSVYPTFGIGGEKVHPVRRGKGSFRPVVTQFFFFNNGVGEGGGEALPFVLQMAFPTILSAMR